MWDLVELSNKPRAPHEVMFGRESGWSHEECFEFDRMILAFERWVNKKKAETKSVSRPKHDSETMDVPKYETLAEIFGEYDETQDRTKFKRPAPLVPESDMANVYLEAFSDAEVMF